MALIRITEENFADIDAVILRDPKQYPQMEDMAVSIDAAFTPEYSKQYAVLLHEKLDPVIDSLPADLQAKYLRMFKVLRLQSLLTVKDEAKAKFFREGILDCFRASYTSVRLWVELIFRSNSNARDIIDSLRKLFVSALRENLESLGSEQIKLPGEDALKPPILKNWLSDYEIFTRNLPTRPASAGRIEEGQYLTSSQNASKLNSADRDILLKVLELYDWLKYSKMEFDYSYPGVKVKPEDSGEEKEHVLISQEMADLINELRSKKGTQKIPAAAPPPQKISSGPRFAQSPNMDFSQRRPSAPQAPVAPPARPEPGPRMLSQNTQGKNEEHPKFRPNLLKPEAPAKSPAAAQKPLPPPNPDQQKATLVAGSSLFNMSLSHALANADQEGLPESGNIRSGAQTPRLSKEKSAPKAAVPSQPKPGLPARPDLQPRPAPLAAPARPNQKTDLPPNLPVAAPALSADRVGPAERSDMSSAFPGIVDLSKRPVLNIKFLTAPEQLQKIDLADADGVLFESNLGEIKQKIADLSREYQLPASRVAENFYRSPLYQLFMSMGVAVMNDNSSPDQRAAFEKVAGNYKLAGKPYLSREQFLSLSRLKKEISESEAKI